MLLLQLKPLLKTLLLASGLVLSACDIGPQNESYDAMATDSQLLDDAKQIIDTAKVLNQIDVLRSKRIADLQPADTSDPAPLPSYVLSGPGPITWENGNNACHAQGRELARQPVAGLENLRYFLQDGAFVRMGNIVGDPDVGGSMIGWIVCEP